MEFLLIFSVFYSSTYIFYKCSAVYDSCEAYSAIIQGFHVSFSDVRGREKNIYFKNAMRYEISSKVQEPNMSIDNWWTDILKNGLRTSEINLSKCHFFTIIPTWPALDKFSLAHISVRLTTKSKDAHEYY
jgi:hypothetical protein